MDNTSLSNCFFFISICERIQRQIYRVQYGDIHAFGINGPCQQNTRMKILPTTFDPLFHHKQMITFNDSNHEFDLFNNL